VVGVVEDTRRTLVGQAHSLRYYLPIAQYPLAGGERYVFVRAAGGAPPDVNGVRAELGALHMQASAAEIVLLRELMDPYVRPWRLGSTVFLVFGVLSQIVAALGLYGVLAFGVAQRRRELGIRVALGASRAGIARLVVGAAVRRVLVAIGCGLIVALAAARLISGLLFDTAETDPLVYAAVAGLAIAVAIVASAVPAVRALRVDPANCLRSD
jgi:ABC-type antimicrobial peptide transport system permease subunit